MIVSASPDAGSTCLTSLLEGNRPDLDVRQHLAIPVEVGDVEPRTGVFVGRNKAKQGSYIDDQRFACHQLQRVPWPDKKHNVCSPPQAHPHHKWKPARQVYRSTGMNRQT